MQLEDGMQILEDKWRGESVALLFVVPDRCGHLSTRWSPLPAYMSCMVIRVGLLEPGLSESGYGSLPLPMERCSFKQKE